jgi:type IV fimbrial biogenesis protein FimT
MSLRPASSGGFTFVELLIVLLIVAILAALATPSLQRAIQLSRSRGALNQLTAEIYRARMLAVEAGYPVRVTLQERGDGCTGAIRTARDESDGGSVELTRTPLELQDLCLLYTGDSTLVFDARGLLRPPARSFSITHGGTTEQVLLSIAGRVRRTY